MGIGGNESSSWPVAADTTINSLLLFEKSNAGTPVLSVSRATDTGEEVEDELTGKVAGAAGEQDISARPSIK